MEPEALGQHQELTLFILGGVRRPRAGNENRDTEELEEGWSLCGALESENLETGIRILCRNQGCGASSLDWEKRSSGCGVDSWVPFCPCYVSLNVSLAVKAGCSLQLR